MFTALTPLATDLLSSTIKGKLMTTDRWFEFLARADRTLDAIAASALAMNYGVHPETGKLDLLRYLPEGTKSLYDTIEFKKNPKWTRTGTEDRYITKIPGVENLEENNNNWVNFRQKVDRIGSKVKGAVKSEDRYNSQNRLKNRFSSIQIFFYLLFLNSFFHHNRNENSQYI